MIVESDGVYGIAIEVPDHGLSYRRMADEQIEAASLYKLGIMVELFRLREEEGLSFDEPVYLDEEYFKYIEEDGGDVYDTSYIGREIPIGELLRDMITLSSNIAGWALLDVTGNDAVNATMHQLGLTNTEIRWQPVTQTPSSDSMASYAGLSTIYPTQRADNAFQVTTAGDMALLFELLVAGQVVNPEASAEMLDLLADQGVRNRLPALLPPGVQVANKTGNLPPDLTHDVGVIYTPAGPAIVAVLTEGVHEWEATVFMQELALLVYQELAG